MKRLVFFIFLLSFFMLGSCDKSNDDTVSPEPEIDKTDDIIIRPIRTPIVLSNEETQVLDKFNQFSVQLFKSMSLSKDNTLISPMSVALTLALSANGDNGETRDILLNALGFEEGETGLILLNEFCKTLLTQLPMTDNISTCQLYNSIWSDTGWDFTPHFTDIAKTYYFSEIFNAPISTTEGINMINEWINDKTNNKISNLVTSPIEMASIFNALYFRGEWIEKFDKKFTQQANFFNADSNATVIDFMNIKSTTICNTQDNGISSVTLSYGANAFAMTLITPDEKTDIRSFISNINYDQIKNIITSYEGLPIELSIPKFRSNNTLNLNRILSHLGFKDETSLKFNNLLDGADFVANLILHVASIEIDENGTSAAAVTDLGRDTAGSPNEKPEFVKMTFDRPFIYVIHEKSSGAILFMGSIMNL